MPWFRKDKKPKPIRKERVRSPVPEGLWAMCSGCKEAIYARELERNLAVCPQCGYHARIDARQRISLLLDDPKPRELFTGLRSSDPLQFKDTKRYKDRLKRYQQTVGSDDAVLVAEGTLEGIPVILAVMQYPFMGGSMGSVVGEKITRAAEAALAGRRPFLVVSASGGARMQEGVLSLMQMAKISAALARLSAARLPFLSILTDPTTGGVTASFAMLGDFNLAEPGALIGFAGPRVIQQTIHQDLPDGFQRSEFLLEHGFLDFVVTRAEMKSRVARCLRHLIS